MKRIISGIVMTLLLIGMLALTFNIQPAKAQTGTIYINADGSVSPSNAPIINVGNTIYTFTGNIYDSIVVERNNIVFDGAGYVVAWIFPDQGYSGIDLSGRSNVTIKDVRINGFFNGIYFNSSSDNTVLGSNITNNDDYGVYLYSSSNNTVSGSNITNNDGCGVQLELSFKNTVSENNITDNGGDGVDLDSSNCTVSGNLITNNSWVGVEFWGGSYISVSGNVFTNDGLDISTKSLHNVVKDNLVNGKPLVYLEDVSGYVVSDAGQVVLVNCDGIAVSNLNLSKASAAVDLIQTINTRITDDDIRNNTYGLALYWNSSKNVISGNNIIESWNGILLENSSGNTVSGNFVGDGMRVLSSYENVVVNNSVNGKPLVYLEDASDRVVTDAGQVILVDCNRIMVENLNLSHATVGVDLWQTNSVTMTRNSITNNWCAVELGDSYNDFVSGNNITNNTPIGVFLENSYNNSVSGNNIANNGFMGVLLENSYNNSVSGNNITNDGNGFYIAWPSSNNKFFHNNFENNTGCGDGLPNTWDNGYPSGGNYWGDLQAWYPNATEIDGSGIWNTPFVICANNVDNYPLMKPWTDFSTQEGRNVTVTYTSGISLTFSNVTSSGITTVNETQTGPSPPHGFKLVTQTPTYIDVKTTANFTGVIQLEIPYNSTGLSQNDQNNLRLMHWNETLQQWTDVTTRVDTVNHVIYGETTSFSPFAIMIRIIMHRHGGGPGAKNALLM